MIAVLKQGESKTNMLKLLEKLMKNKKPKGVNVHKYCGTINLREDPLSIQKKLRDEWD